MWWVRSSRPCEQIEEPSPSLVISLFFEPIEESGFLLLLFLPSPYTLLHHTIRTRSEDARGGYSSGRKLLLRRVRVTSSSPFSVPFNLSAHTLQKALKTTTFLPFDALHALDYKSGAPHWPQTLPSDVNAESRRRRLEAANVVYCTIGEVGDNIERKGRKEGGRAALVFLRLGRVCCCISPSVRPRLTQCYTYVRSVFRF